MNRNLSVHYDTAWEFSTTIMDFGGEDAYSMTGGKPLPTIVSKYDAHSEGWASFRLPKNWVIV